MTTKEIHSHHSYKNNRPDILKLIKNKPNKVLDVGCNQGKVSQSIKEVYQSCRCWGIEIDSEAIKIAAPIMEEIWNIDIDNLELLKTTLHNHSFDLIIAGDVLEHTVNVEEVTKELYEKLTPGGKIIISIPNWGHWHLLYVFFMQKWPRNESGIFDKTHKQVFMPGNIKEFQQFCDGSIFKLEKRRFRFSDSQRLGKLNPGLTLLLSPLFYIPYLRNFFTRGFIFSLQKPIRK